ncbi:hypothetical protein BKA67DRAFT_584082 [Truncatella angustata]|uniref:Dpy-30 domain-containing protein n=1 Tax=Truncatella angustata TaxID=152316 RepID=A0A9P8UCX0_9PEZI|nr:uncharacterized protein BKA67DRAFT_584082 [Truncatella angustata]KAH6646372.1 hypothetical protein BKA67DRAFT_584082 [Truncatella angustata]KAH8195221.1 hypothetical protein TruAng_010604 [Truncatella angustata]
MAEESRRVSTTPIPVPVPFGAHQPTIQPTPSPLSQQPIAAPPPPPVDTSTNANATATATSTTATTDIVAPESIAPASKDVAMTDAEPIAAASPAPQQHAASPAPGGRAGGTPARATNGMQESSSRAASAHPDPGFTMPSEAPPHGAPARQYLNSKVTGAVLEGMKLVAKEQPRDPLRVLGEFLLQRSKDIEGST